MPGGGDYYKKLDEKENILYEDADIPGSIFKKKEVPNEGVDSKGHYVTEGNEYEDGDPRNDGIIKRFFNKRKK